MINSRLILGMYTSSTYFNEKIKVLKVLKDGGVKSWVGLSRCYCCLISLGMVKQQNEIKRQMFIEHIARFDKRGRTFK